MGTSSSKSGKPAPSRRTSLRLSIKKANSKADAEEKGWTDQDAELGVLEHAIFAANGVARPGSDAYVAVAPVDDSDDVTTARDEDAVERVLRGNNIEDDDVRMRKSAVRIFVSSTFTDTNAERNAFLAFCAPYLREVCRRRDLELVVSEMRWGVTEAMSDSHQTSQLCMREVDRCLNESAAMQFVGILGNKYGFQPLPTSVDAEQFEDILTAVKSDEEASLLTKWFVLDENAVPSAYVLLPVSSVIEAYNASVSDDASRAWWTDNFEPLQRIFQKHSDFATRSVTEDEMLRGVQDPEQCLLIVRDFDADVSGDRNYADDHEDALGKLRTEIVARVEPAGNVLRYDAVPWKEGGIDAVRHPATHGKYLADVLTDWTHKVEASIAGISAPTPDGLVEEAQAHWRFAFDRVQTFVGRGDLVQAVGDLATSSKLVHGVSGVGKTSVLAMTTAELSSSSAIIIPRFLGTTVASRTVRPLLESMCDQLWRIYHSDDDDSERPDFPLQQYDLQLAFVRTYLALATEDRPLVLILDSVDQVLDAGALDWLPAASDLPEHVSLIVSVLSDDEALLAHAQRKGYADEVAVALLRMEDVPDVLATWLAARSRTLSAAQQAFILDTLRQCEKPTYLLLRVLFNEALEWHSFSPLPEQSWSNITSIASAVDVLLAKVEAEFGEVLTTTALALLTFARDGLSDVELADLLSADNDVLAEVFEWWLPPQARVPPLLVTRLLDTLRDYFVSAGTNKWFHRQFWETAQARYVPRQQTALDAVADYFLGEMNPAALDMPRYKQRLGRHRQLPEQPFFVDSDTSNVNVRKLRELPRALLDANRIDEAVALLTDVRFIVGMFSAGLHNELTYKLLMDARLPASDVLSDLQQVLELGRTALLAEPLELASQLFGRLPPGHALLNDVEGHYERLGVSWLKPMRPTLEPARSPLRKTLLGHTDVVYALAYAHELDMIISGSWDKTVKMWKASTGELVRTLEGHSEPVNSVAAVAELDMVVSGSADKTVKCWKASTGELLRTLEGHSDIVRSVAVASELGVIVSGSNDSAVKVWKASTGELLRTMGGDSWASVHSVTVAAELDMIVTGNADNAAKVWKASTGELLWTLEGHSAWVSSVAVSAELDMIVSGSADMSIKLWEASTGELLRTLEGHSSNVESVAVAAELDIIASGSTDRTVKVWKASTGELLRTEEGHSLFVHSVVVAAEADMIISGSADSTVKVWKASTGELLRAHEGHVDAVTSMATAAELDMVVTGSADWTVRVWKGSTGELMRTLQGHHWFVWSVAVAAELDFIVSGSSDKTVKVWKASTGELLRTLEGHSDGVRSVAVASELDMIVSGSGDKTVKVWKASTGELLRTLEGHSDSVWSVAVVAELDMVVSGSKDKTVKAWKASTGELRWTLEGHSGEVTKVAVAAELDVIVSTDSGFETLLWDLATGQQVTLDAVPATRGDSGTLLRDGTYRVSLLGCTVGFSTDTAAGGCGVLHGVVTLGDWKGRMHYLERVN